MKPLIELLENALLALLIFSVLSFLIVIINHQINLS